MLRRIMQPSRRAEPKVRRTNCKYFDNSTAQPSSRAPKKASGVSKRRYTPFSVPLDKKRLRQKRVKVISSDVPAKTWRSKRSEISVDWPVKPSRSRESPYAIAGGHRVPSHLGYDLTPLKSILYFSGRA